MRNIKRLTAYILTFVLIFTSLPDFSLADILITEDVILEQDLRFSVISDTKDASIDVPFQSGYKNVQVISSEVDNGHIDSTTVNTDSVTVELDGGTPTNSSTTKTITHSDTITITDKVADSSNIISLPASSDCDSITAITGVSSAEGSLISASGVGTTTLKVLVDPNKGKSGYDYNNTTDKYVDISAPSNNRNKACTARTTVTPYKSAYVNEADKYGSTCYIDTSGSDTGVIAVNFTDGIVSRKINTNLAYSCPKRWVDRHLDLVIDTPTNSGGRKVVKINPNGIVGVPYDSFTDSNTYAKPSNVDFWGYYLGKAPGNNNVSYPTGANNLFLCYDKLGLGSVGSRTFVSNDFDKYGVNGNSAISETYDIISTGIRTTSNAIFKRPAEQKEAYPYESQDTFYDPLYWGDLKTKVYHWYYWAGIDKWGVFGGYYYYPYKARVHYLAYNPAKLYNGSVTYEYEEQQVIPSGKYNYNGKVRIRYTITRTILDKPPTTPGGVIATKDKIMNGVSSDDYTPEAQLRYRYYYYNNNTWNYLGENTGVREYVWNPASLGLNLLNLHVGVIAVDNRDQVSGRAENDPNATIDLTGSLGKTVVKPGETLDIYAKTDSSPEAYEVEYNIENKYGKGLMAKNGKLPYEVNINTVSGKWNNFYNSSLGRADYNDGHVTQVDRYNSQGTFEDFVSTDNYFYRVNYKSPQMVNVLKSVADITANGSHAGALKLDGSVYVWGNNSLNIQSMKHLTKLNSLSNIIAVDSGGVFMLALKNDGTVYAWGRGTSGQLGNGSSENSAAPVKVSGLTNIIAISAGSKHALALKGDGTVYAWGSNNSGQIGSNSTTGTNIPVQVTGLSNVKAISAGDSHNLALTNDGTVYAWGANGKYQVGNTTTTDALVPVKLSYLTNITSVSAGGSHSLALKGDGTVWAWGNNGSGQVGNNSTSNRKSPIQINISGVTYIAAGDNFSMALKSDGTYWGWGGNTSGQLGNGLTTNLTIPTQISGINNISKIDGGNGYTLFTKSDGSVWASGGNTKGQLGNGTFTSSLVPVSMNNSSIAIMAKAGITSTVVLKNDGTVWTTGNNDAGQLGFTSGSIDNSNTPIQVSGLTGIKSISAGGNHYLFLKNDGTVYSYGLNTGGQLGNGTTEPNMSPAIIPGLNNVKEVCAGGSHNLALKYDGSVWAWGKNSDGQAGNNTKTDVLIPTQITSLNNVIAIGAGRNHSMAITSDGAVYSWGDGSMGQIGNGYTDDKRVPTLTKGLPANSVKAVTGGGAHSLALLNNGKLKGWGRNRNGQLGCNDTDDAYSAADVLVLGNVVAVDAGGAHSLALKGDGTVWAWGDNTYYQVSSGSSEADILTPIQVSYLSNVAKITSGDSFNLALKSDGTIWSWGNDGSGQLGFENKYTYGKQGTIIMPGINRYGFDNKDLLDTVSLVGQNTIKKTDSDGEYLTNCYVGDIQSINPESSSSNNCFGTVTYFQYTQNFGGVPMANSYQTTMPSWASSGGYVTGVYTYVQIWNQRVGIPYWDLPVTITFNDKKYRVYQNGSFIAEVTADKNMEGIELYIPAMRSKTGDESTDRGHAYKQLGSTTGKTVLTDKAWSIDNINTFIAGAYGDTYHIANPAKFRQQNALVEDGNGFCTLDYGGVRTNHALHPANLPDYLPGTLLWKTTVTLPINITGGYHTVTLTARNGLGKSINLTFLVDIPEALNPKGVIPYYVTQGKTYTTTARTTTQANTMDLIVFGNIYPMQYVKTVYNDPDYPGGAKCWTYNITIPTSAEYGIYNQMGGTRRMAEFKALSAAGRTESDYQPFNVLLSLKPVGDIPDSIETKTDWKARCTTNSVATSVTVAIDPSPGASPYDMVMISNDGSKKIWGTEKLQYPEGLTGASGRPVTGIFTAKGPNNSVETDTDTGMLYEKIEVTDYEIRRYLFKDGDKSKPIVETLCRSLNTRTAGSAGFLMAGWEMGIKVITKGYVDRIEYDFTGSTINGETDLSIKTLDKLTRKLEWETPVNREKTPFSFASLQELQQHYAFPKQFEKIFNKGNGNENIFTTYYLVPYGTKQSLHSWYTLRQENKDAFEIDKNRLLERIKDPFVLRLRLYSGARSVAKEIKLDIFERWDTLLNRDIRPYIDNPGEHNPVDRNVWETTLYVEH